MPMSEYIFLQGEVVCGECALYTADGKVVYDADIRAYEDVIDEK